MTKRMLPMLGAVVLIVGSAVSAAGGSTTNSPPAWGTNPRVDGAGDLVQKILSGAANSSHANASGMACAAEPSTTGNVQVNCRAEDGTSPANTQSETSVSAVGDKVVVGYNDSLVCCIPSLNLSGYSVSTDGGKSFTDMGDLPFDPNVQPLGDPSVAHDSAGNFYYASLALGSAGFGTHSLISFYKMPAGSNQFQLVSTAVDVGSSHFNFADKEYLAIAPDANGQTHFYISWTSFTKNIQSPIMLTDSTDGVNWRTAMVSTADACAQGSNPVPSGGTVYVSWFQSIPSGCTDAHITAANAMMATVNVASDLVATRTIVSPIHGSGDAIVACNSPRDLREVIETAPGHDVRNFEMPTTTIDANGFLYAAWNDRPNGVGGDTSNATEIYLSYSLDGNVTWSVPQAISGRLSHKTMNDRFQPWLTSDAGGLHAMWYERVAGNPVDLVQADKADLSPASATSAPVSSGEAAISSVAFPVVQTNPNQDPIISNCYMGDYNNIASNGSARFVTWGDNRNIVTTTNGSEVQPDVFMQSY